MTGNGTRRPACPCGQLAAPVRGVDCDGLAYKSWECAYWPVPRCDYQKITRKERRWIWREAV